MTIPFARPNRTTNVGGNVFTFGFKPVGRSVGPPVVLKFSRHYYAFSPTQMFIRFGFIPRGTTIPTVQIIDTHDGVKKKKKQRTFDEELERTAKLKKQIHEVVYPVTPQESEPEIEPRTEPEVAKPLVLKTGISPPVDYAGLAKDEIVAKIKQDVAIKARQHQEELKRLELQRIADEEEEEEELQMILDAIL